MKILCPSWTSSLTLRTVSALSLALRQDEASQGFDCSNSIFLLLYKVTIRSYTTVGITGVVSCDSHTERSVKMIDLLM